MKNLDIRAEAKEKGVFLYEIAEKLGISDPTMTRLLRHELPQKKKEDIKEIISEISTTKATENKETA